MKFSIIIPVYNAEKYIEQSIQSVLNQSNPDFEIVLVNDGSTDDSGNICDKLVQMYPEKVRVLHQENQGQLLTRCNGIRFSFGEYCVFLDADDVLVPDGLALLEDAIIRYDNPDMVIYSFFYDKLSGNKERAVPLFPEEKVFNGEEQKKELYRKFFTTTLLNNVWTKAVKRTVFDGVFPDYTKYANVRCSEDRLHSMGMVSNAEKVVYINKPIYEYKLIPNSISRTFTIDSIARFNVKSLYKEELKYLDSWKLELSEWKNRLDANWILQTWYALDMFYNNVEDRIQKKQILDYAWKNFVPDELLTEYVSNTYLSEQQKQCWKWIVEKEQDALKLYFFKKNIYVKLRQIKRSFLRKRK